MVGGKEEEEEKERKKDEKEKKTPMVLQNRKISNSFLSSAFC
jgi:hypothetical protein